MLRPLEMATPVSLPFLPPQASTRSSAPAPVRRAAWLPVALLACAGLASAQTATLRRYGNDQGLLGLAGTCLLQSRRTALWVCTESGLYRFDGQRFQQVALDGARSHAITAMSEDAQGRLWVASFDALFVGDERGFRRLAPDESGRLHQDSLRLASPAWGTVVINHGQALRAVALRGGRWRLQPLFDAATLARVPELRHLVGAQALGDTLWLGCGRGICAVDAQARVRRFGPAEGVPDDAWFSFALDGAGAVWARARDHVLQRPAGAEGFVSHRFPGIALNAIGRQAPLVSDRQGRILVRTHDGLVRHERGRWRPLDRRNGLPESSSGAMRVDRDGDLWMTVDGEGLVRWTGYDWIESWDASQGMRAAPTWSIVRDAAGGLLVGNEHGVSRQPPQGGRFSPWLPQAGNQVVGLRRRPDGTLWSVTSSGHLVRYAADGRHGVEVARITRPVKQLFFDRDGRLWLLTSAGVLRLDTPELGGVPQPEPQLPVAAWSDIQQSDDGTLWVAGARGVFRLRDGRWSAVPLRVDGQPTQRWVAKLRVVGRDEVWLAFYQPGLWHGRLGDGGMDLQPADDRRFAELMIYLIRRDRSGRLWVGHNRGVDLFDGRRWSRLSQSQGLLWDDVSENALFEDDDGSIWIGTARGVSHLLAPQRLLAAAAPPALTISEFSRGGVRIVPGQRLPWSEQQLHLKLSASAALDDPGRAWLRYRMVGLHAGWIYVQSFVIEHPPLPAGRYRLEVQLLDNYRRTASAPVALAFEVAPLWWRSPAALAGYALLALAVLVAAWRARHRQLLARERVLAQLVAERTGELEREKRELEQARAALALKASHDALTGLLNRAGVLDAVVAEMEAAARQGQPLALVLIDLDHFKLVNDRYGHLVGDAVLAQVGARLDACVRGSDRVGRYGGEELLAILPGMPRHGRHRLHVLHDAIGRRPYLAHGQTLEMTCSIGVAWYREGESVGALLMRADEALYRAKHLGRNRIELEPEDTTAAAP